MSTYDRSVAQRSFYDEAYRTDNYFSHRELLYRPYIRSLIAVAGLQRGSQVLDAGCGQGFFAHLFATEGMSVYGTDMSIVGLALARAHYGRDAGRFFVSDLTQAPTNHQFDAVFVRSCSLYNTDRVDKCIATTERLLAMVKPNGVFIFAYNTNLSRESNGWRHHRLEDIRRFLEPSCPGVDLYFVNKVDTFLLRRGAFNRAVTRINTVISRRTGRGGEAVAVFRKRAQG